jgi:hypothetical protein
LDAKTTMKIIGDSSTGILGFKAEYIKKWSALNWFCTTETTQPCDTTISRQQHGVHNSRVQCGKSSLSMGKGTDYILPTVRTISILPMPNQWSAPSLLQGPWLLLESLCNSSLDLPELLHLEIFPDTDENKTGD